MTMWSPGYISIDRDNIKSLALLIEFIVNCLLQSNIYIYTRSLTTLILITDSLANTISQKIQFCFTLTHSNSNLYYTLIK